MIKTIQFHDKNHIIRKGTIFHYKNKIYEEWIILIKPLINEEKYN